MCDKLVPDHRALGKDLRSTFGENQDIFARNALFPEILKTMEKLAENTQTYDLTRKIEIEGRTRQNAECKQTFAWTEKLKLRENSSKR